MKRGSQIILRHFECQACGQRMSACKWYEKTAKGHIKTMWCPKCKAERDFIQVDTDMARI